MKRLLAMILAITMLFSLAACGGEDKKSAGSNGNKENNGISNDKDDDTTKKEEKEDLLNAVLLEEYEDVGNDPNNLALSATSPAFDDDFIYYAEGNTIYRMDKETATTEYVVSAEANGDITYLNLYDGAFYFKIETPSGNIGTCFDTVAKIDSETLEYEILYQCKDENYSSLESVYVLNGKLFFVSVYNDYYAGVSYHSYSSYKDVWFIDLKDDNNRSNFVCGFTDHKITTQDFRDDYNYISVPKKIYLNADKDNLYVYAKDFNLTEHERGGASSDCCYFITLSMTDDIGKVNVMNSFEYKDEYLLVNKGIMKYSYYVPSTHILIPSGLVSVNSNSSSNYKAYANVSLEENDWTQIESIPWGMVADEKDAKHVQDAYHYLLGANRISIGRSEYINGKRYDGGEIYFAEYNNKNEPMEICRLSTDGYKQLFSDTFHIGAWNDTLYIITENVDEEKILMTITSDGEITETVIN